MNDYVIVQAGGRGSRLRHLVWNKPKCLVSINGKPIIYSLFDRFPNSKFIIIGDYRFNELEKYLAANEPKVSYTLIKASAPGTASGIGEALSLIPQNSDVILTWCDLIINDLPEWPEVDCPVVCTTSSFVCRWSVNPEGGLHEKPSSKGGIPGLFYFPKAALLSTVPPKGEFVRWFAGHIADYALLDCNNLEEMGEFDKIKENYDRAGFCRFFNHVEINGDKVTKTVIDPRFAKMHKDEISWYNAAFQLGFNRMPRVYSESPLVLERIQGQHAWQANNFTPREKRAILANYLDTLKYLHSLGQEEASDDEIRSVYIDKTFSRIKKVSSIIPDFEKESFTINGLKCRNFFSPKHEGIFEEILPSLQVDEFVPIHGDPTFSNTLVDDKLRVWFIDPRGYFSKPGIYGDPWYDFAKVYYSAVGGYDHFNRKDFKLYIDDGVVEVLLPPSSFNECGEAIFKEYFGKEIARIKVLHGLIWLALAGYSIDDIDASIGAYFFGVYWLERGLSCV